VNLSPELSGKWPANRSVFGDVLMADPGIVRKDEDRLVRSALIGLPHKRDAAIALLPDCSHLAGASQ
jgi:hypothetical protein